MRKQFRICQTATCCLKFRRWTVPGKPFTGGHTHCVCGAELQWKELPPHAYRQGFRDTVDYSYSKCGKDKSERIDLGLALMSLLSRSGQQWTYADIAAWCGCSDGAIYRIEKIALRKLRKKPEFMRVLKEAGGIGMEEPDACETYKVAGGQLI